MANLNEIEMPERVDYAQHWAVMREYDLRYRRYQLAQKGVLHVFAEAAKSAQRFTEALVGINAVVTKGKT